MAPYAAFLIVLFGVVFSEPFSGSFPVSKDKACAACRNVSKEVTKVLSDPKTEKLAVSFVEVFVCSNFPDPVLKKCEAFVKENIPRIFSTVEDRISLSSLCFKTRICTNSSASEPSMVVNQDSILKKTIRCDVCEEIAEKLLTLLQKGNTQAEILSILHKTCKSLKVKSLEAKCDAFVDDNFPQLIALIVSLSPAEVCSITQQCQSANAASFMDVVLMASSALSKVTELALGKGTQECLACRLLVTQARKTLRNPKYQLELQEYLNELCTKAPEYEAECKAAVAEYLPEIFSNIDVVVDPRKVCAKLKLCPAEQSRIGRAGISSEFRAAVA